MSGGARVPPIADFGGATLVDLLRWRAAGQGDQRLFTFLPDGGGAAVPMSFAALDARARAIAARLAAVAAPGDRALLLYAGGPEFVEAFFGCLYAGLVAVPAYPPEPARLARTLPRLNGIATDARPRVVLTTSEILGLRAALAALSPGLFAYEWLASDAVDTAAAGGWSPPAVSPATVALMQYTSGSTGTPKGVMVSHGNLLRNEEMIRVAFDHDETSSVVGWLPVFHDMGLIGNVLQPVYMGVPCTLMSPLAFLQRPARWLRAIAEARATTSGAPNFAYELCVRKVTAEERAALDLSSWTLAFSGSEPVSAETLARFTRAFAPCGFRPETFYPCYGMAEATLIVSGGIRAEVPRVLEVDAAALERHDVVPGAGAGARRLVGCGRRLLDERLVIVDPERAVPLPAGRVGEIWVAGSNVALGYWERPEETAHAFAARLAGGDGPFLRTGDLGFLRDGELFVTGRLKDVIIVRGRNHYPQDLERTVAASDTALREGSGAAFTVPVAGEERLVVVQELKREAEAADLDGVLGNIREAVTAQHQLRLHAAVLIEAGTIPKTSSGKICRRACRDLYQREALAEKRRWVHGARRRARTLTEAMGGIEMAQRNRGAVVRIQVEPRNGPKARRRGERIERMDRRFAYLTSLGPFLGTVLALGLLVAGVPVGWREVSLLVGMYALATIGIEIGYHRLFTHRAFETSPAMKTVLAILGSMSFQGPVIWWAATHRRHHGLTDKPGDPHSPLPDAPGLRARLHALWVAHFTWTFDPMRARPPGWADFAKDLYRDTAVFRVHYSYLSWMMLGLAIPTVVGGLVSMSVRGAVLGFLWGGPVRLFLNDHAIRALNSASHVVGTRAFETDDESRNNWWLVIPTLGQGWHNNHHAFPTDAYVSKAWWQIDPGGWLIRALEAVGLVWNVRTLGPEVVEARRLA